MKNGNEPINPQTITVRVEDKNSPEFYSYKDLEFRGLTKREYFAGLAMQGILSSNPACYQGNREGQCVPSEVAKDAIAHADELLKQLEL